MAINVASEIKGAIAFFFEAVARTVKDKSTKPIEKSLQREMQSIFARQQTLFLKKLESFRHKFAEALSKKNLESIMTTVEAGTNKEMQAAIEAAGGTAILAASGQRIAEMGVDISFDLKNPRAVKWLKDNAAQKFKDIQETTQNRIATIVTQSADEGWSYNRTAKAISDEFVEFRVGKPQLHIQSRAHLVAITETADAYEAGNVMVVEEMEAIGLKMQKKWQTVGDDRVSIGCRTNQGNGWIPVGRAHSEGPQSEHPPRFPGCRCSELYRRKPK